MNIHKATRKYEAWLGGQIPLIPQDLRRKHTLMRQAVFPFFRATFYRWCQLWPEVCPEAAKSPIVLAVGDLHVENFGTWRDHDGRLVWGINDFDEVAVMHYTLDLVRLAVSARLAIEADHLRTDVNSACDCILSGYRDALKAGGRPIVLGEHHHWLRELATSESRDPLQFWEKMGRLPTARRRIPRSAIKAIESLMPDSHTKYRVAQRTAGLGASAGNVTQPSPIGREAKLPAKPKRWRRPPTVGRRVAKPSARFFTRKRWIARFAAAIPLCASAVGGSSGASLLIVRGSSYPLCQSKGMSCGCFMRWDGKQRMSTAEPQRP